MWIVWTALDTPPSTMPPSMDTGRSVINNSAFVYCSLFGSRFAVHKVNPQREQSHRDNTAIDWLFAHRWSFSSVVKTVDSPAAKWWRRCFGTRPWPTSQTTKAATLCIWLRGREMSTSSCSSFTRDLRILNSTSRCAQWRFGCVWLSWFCG